MKDVTVRKPLFCLGLMSRVPIPVARRCKGVSPATHLLGLRFRIPPAAWMSATCSCCVLLGRGLCVGLITRPGDSKCDREVSTTRRPWPTMGCCALEKEKSLRPCRSTMPRRCRGASPQS